MQSIDTMATLVIACGPLYRDESDTRYTHFAANCSAQVPEQVAQVIFMSPVTFDPQSRSR